MTNRTVADFIEHESGRSYLSDWMLVDPQLIDKFADTTRDWNFMHVDPEKAGQTEFGGTIAHGFLVLSLLAPLRSETPRPRIPGLKVGLNYGLDRVRFINPVHAGKRIRARFRISDLSEVEPGRVREVMDVLVEVEGSERPAIAASWLTMYMV